jgi:hypothetical protein
LRIMLNSAQLKAKTGAELGNSQFYFNNIKEYIIIIQRDILNGIYVYFRKENNLFGITLHSTSIAFRTKSNDQ